MFRILFTFILVLGLSSCADRTFAPVLLHSASVGTIQTVYVATTRQTDENGYYGRHRSSDIGYLEVDVSIPPSHKPGTLRIARHQPDPARHFTIARQTEFPSGSGFLAGLRRDISKLPPDERDVMIYVHGYNNSFSDSVFRVAQLDHDFAIPGISVAYSWPSDAHPLGYSHDRDSALFARDGLEALLRQMPETGARQIILVAHSLGSLLVMETLRQIEIAEPGWSQRNLDGVVLISPDIDVDLFRQQASRIRALPQPFAVFVSKRDRVLSLSARINGVAQRLGQVTDASELSEIPLTLLDVSDFAGDGLQPGHFTVGTSPALISLLSQSTELQRVLQKDPSGRAGTLHGTVISVQKATQMVLSPGLLRKE